MRDQLGTWWRGLLGLYTNLTGQGSGNDLLAGIFPSGRGDAPSRTAAAYLEAYNTSPWLRAVVGKVSFSVAATPWRLYSVQRRGRDGKERFVRVPTVQRASARERAAALIELRAAGELKPIVRHPLLDLLEGANAVLTGLAARQLVQVYLDLLGEAFWLKERDSRGTIIAVWPIPPHWVRATPTPSQPYYEVSFRGWQGRIPDAEMLWMSNPDPQNPYARGSGVAQALADELETDEFAAKHAKAFFYNRARPDLLVVLDGADTTEAKRLEQDWLSRTQGFWKAFKPYFMAGQGGVTVKELSQSFADMQLSQLRQHERDIVIQVYGVPPEIVGIIENSNRATIEASETLFTRHVLVPRLEVLRAMWQERLVPEFDGRLILDYESPVVEDRELQLQARRAAPWAAMVDEWRSFQGLPPLPNNAGQVFLVPRTLDVVPAAEYGRRPIAPPTPVPAPAPAAAASLDDGATKALADGSKAEDPADVPEEELQTWRERWGEVAPDELRELLDAKPMEVPSDDESST